jgi:RNA polymerase sigma-70 factor (ECF subfamily)
MARFHSSDDPIAERRTAEFLRYYSAHQAGIFAYIFTLLPNWHDAEEVYQEMSVVLWRAFDEFQPGTDFRAWACKVAFHQVLSFRKRSKRSALLPGLPMLELIARDVEELAPQLDSQLEALMQCVKELPPRMRDIVDRCYQSGASTRDVAAQMGRPAGTIYKTLTRIRQGLYECIQRKLLVEDI